MGYGRKFFIFYFINTYSQLMAFKRTCFQVRAEKRVFWVFRIIKTIGWRSGRVGRWVQKIYYFFSNIKMSTMYFYPPPAPVCCLRFANCYANSSRDRSPRHENETRDNNHIVAIAFHTRFPNNAISYWIRCFHLNDR